MPAEEKRDQGFYQLEQNCETEEEGREQDPKEAAHFVERAKLEEYGHGRVDRQSKGNQQKVVESFGGGCGQHLREEPVAWQTGEKPLLAPAIPERKHGWKFLLRIFLILKTKDWL
jgi:hypothetical protein